MKLDFKAVVNAIWLPFLVWLAAVITVAFGGRQPGVICVTPMAWLLALWVGLRCAVRTRSAQRSSRLTEAALAGAVFGLLQGVLFTLIAPFMGSVQPGERQKAMLLSVIMIVLGAIVSGVLSVAIGASQEKRRTAK